MTAQSMLLGRAISYLQSPSIKSSSLCRLRALTHHVGSQSRLVSNKTTKATLKASTNIAIENREARKPIFPERLLIYHAGTMRIVNLAGIKVVTIFVFAFFTIYAAPQFFYSDEDPTWVTAVVTLSGIIPVAMVSYMSGPFVNFIHLRLPTYARASRDIMLRYSKTLPKDAELDITTMNFLGKVRVSRMRITELCPVKERFGLANYARDTHAMNSRRAWWKGRLVRQFGVHAGRSKILGGEVWKNVALAISRNSKQK